LEKRKKMKQVSLIAAMLGVVLLGMVSLTTEPVSYAYQAATPRPTATNIGAGSGRSSASDSEAPAPPLVGIVKGFVYNISAGGAPEPGITVILDGGGWQAETLTDSNGFYEFAGLGDGQAILNLRLPPNAHPLMPDWPVYTRNTEATQTHLAYYWGDDPPLPVILSSTSTNITTPANQDFELELLVKNQSGGVASKGVIDVNLPTSLETTAATVTHGQVDFSHHRVLALLTELADGETAIFRISGQFDDPLAAQTATVRAVLNYQEQLTPQVIEIALTSSDPVSEPAPAAAAQPKAASASSTESSTQPETEAALPTTGSGTQSQPDSQSQQLSQPEQEAKPQAIEAAPQEAAPALDDNNTAATIPVTGADIEAVQQTNWTLLVLSMVAILGLAAMGIKVVLAK
jgi:hypothetical protein